MVTTEDPICARTATVMGVSARSTDDSSGLAALHTGLKMSALGVRTYNMGKGRGFRMTEIPKVATYHKVSTLQLNPPEQNAHR